jgi:hypothetical protein
MPEPQLAFRLFTIGRIATILTGMTSPDGSPYGRQPSPPLAVAGRPEVLRTVSALATGFIVALLVRLLIPGPRSRTRGNDPADPGWLSMCPICKVPRPCAEPPKRGSPLRYCRSGHPREEKRYWRAGH